MSIKKRVLGLAVAGTAALVLGGAFTLSGHPGNVDAAGASVIQLGCAQTVGGATNATNLVFPVNTTTGQLSGTVGTGTGNNVATGSANTAGTLNIINLLAPQNFLQCAAVLQDSTTGSTGTTPTTFTGGATAVTGGTSTITGGTQTVTGGTQTPANAFTTTFTGAGGTTTISGGTVTITGGTQTNTGTGVSNGTGTSNGLGCTTTDTGGTTTVTGGTTTASGTGATGTVSSTGGTTSTTGGTLTTSCPNAVAAGTVAPTGTTTFTGGTTTTTGSSLAGTGTTNSNTGGTTTTTPGNTFVASNTGCTTTDSGGTTTITGSTTTVTGTGTTGTVASSPANTTTTGGTLITSCPNTGTAGGTVTFTGGTVTGTGVAFSNTGGTAINAGGTTTGGTSTGGGNLQDGNPNTVDGGNVIYTLNGANGRFVILDTLSSTATKTCGDDQNVGAGGGYESCEGAIGTGTIGNTAGTFGTFTNTGTFVTPNPALVITVGFAPGVALSSFGNLSGLGGIGSGVNGSFFSLTATYQRFNDLNTQGVGSSSVSTTIALGLSAPTYGLTLAANPTTISASPTVANSTSNVAQGGTGGGSTITATLFTTNTPLIIGIAPGVNLLVGGQGTTAGVEPGIVTFTTNAGIFGGPSSVSASAQQTVSVACGAAPGTGLTFNQQTFSFGTFSFSSCTTATATLFGGGAAGTATVVATFDGAITGQTAQGAVTVGFSPLAATVNLSRGCNEYITPASFAANTPIATLVSTVSPSSAVVSIYQYNNATQSFNGLFFSTPGAPTNGNSVGPSQSIFICASGPATVGTGAF